MVRFLRWLFGLCPDGGPHHWHICDTPREERICTGINLPLFVATKVAIPQFRDAIVDDEICVKCGKKRTFEVDDE